MNQTRVFLIFAWLMVAVLLWMEWGREKNAPDPATVATTQPAVPAATDADLAPPPAGNVPQANVPGQAPAATASVEAATAAPRTCPAAVGSHASMVDQRRRREVRKASPFPPTRLSAAAVRSPSAWTGPGRTTMASRTVWRALMKYFL